MPPPNGPRRQSAHHHRLQGLPPELQTRIMSYLPLAQSTYIYQQHPQLKQHRHRRGIVVTFITEGQQLCDDFLSYNDDRKRFNVNLPPEFDITKLHTLDPSYIIDQLKDIPFQKENNGIPIILEFCFDLHSKSCYEPMNLYPHIADFLPSELPHHINIFKQEMPLHRLTKSKSHTLRLFDRVLRAEAEVGPDIRPDTLFLKFHMPSFRTLEQQQQQRKTKATFFFNDIPVSQKLKLTDPTFPLQSVCVLLPNTKYDLSKEPVWIKTQRSSTISSIRNNLSDYFYELSYVNFRDSFHLSRFPFNDPRGFQVGRTGSIASPDFNDLETTERLFHGLEGITVDDDQFMDVSNIIYAHFNYDSQENQSSTTVDGELEDDQDGAFEEHLVLNDTLITLALFQLYLTMQKYRIDDLQQKFIRLSIWEKDIFDDGEAVDFDLADGLMRRWIDLGEDFRSQQHD